MCCCEGYVANFLIIDSVHVRPKIFILVDIPYILIDKHYNVVW